jgi:hypothetical protein
MPSRSPQPATGLVTISQGSATLQCHRPGQTDGVSEPSGLASQPGHSPAVAQDDGHETLHANQPKLAIKFAYIDSGELVFHTLNLPVLLILVVCPDMTLQTTDGEARVALKQESIVFSVCSYPVRPQSQRFVRPTCLPSSAFWCGTLYDRARSIRLIRPVSTEVLASG